MTSTSIYEDIATRTGGDIYIGVVGPVRTGKSTFIKRFMDTLVLPNIPETYARNRAMDELPQSSSGRTIMTTEPKFIPENAVEVRLPDNASFRVRMIDCVGYIVPSALGYVEGEQPRMVMTPWYQEPIPFNMAAELGTKKVITDHSTIGLVVTTDGSIGDIPRAEYAEAEERVIGELQEIRKPFVVLLNSMYPTALEVQALAGELTEKYGVPVLPVNCMELDEAGVRDIITRVLFEFPVRQINVGLPRWVTGLAGDHPVRKELYATLGEAASPIRHIRQVNAVTDALSACSFVEYAGVEHMDLGNGMVQIGVRIIRKLFYDILSEQSGLQIDSDETLLQTMGELAETKRKYAKVKDALDEVEATGYGIVMPDITELRLDEPEIMKQGGRYGVRLRASAPSIHMMRADITTEVSPIVGSEKQSEDLILYLLREFEDDPVKIWDSNIFGKSLHELVNEGLHTKLARMPGDARMRLQETLERVINEGCSGLICIIL